MDIYIVIAVLLLSFLSFSNGGNDVSKAIATLVGANVASVKKAVMWGVFWTMIGSIVGLFFGAAIIKNITENIYVVQPKFTFGMALAIALSPSLWVMLSTICKWPVSTTHAVMGGLLGAGMSAIGVGGIAWKAAMLKIGLPLLLSPFLAITLAYFFSPFLQRFAVQLQRLRFCVSPVPKKNGSLEEIKLKSCVTCDKDSKEAKVTPNFGISVDSCHWFSSGLLSFSRGLNDTPKLIAVILPFLLSGSVENISMFWMFVVSAFTMAVGGLIIGGRITKILGFKVTKLNHEEGFAANAISTFLVLVASKFGMPVSTTHVSASSIMGIGLSNKEGLNKTTVYSMLFAWLITVPVSGFFAYLIFTFCS